MRARVLSLAVIPRLCGTELARLGLMKVMTGTLRGLIVMNPCPPVALAIMQPTAALEVALVAAGMLKTGMDGPPALVMFLRDSMLVNLGPVATTLTFP